MCWERNVECVYSPGSPSQNNPALSTSPQGFLIGEAEPWLMVPLEVSDATDKAFSDAAIMQATQDESSNTNCTMSNKIRERKTSVNHRTVWWYECHARNSCRGFSAEMDALNQEIAEKVSHCPCSLSLMVFAVSGDETGHLESLI